MTFEEAMFVHKKGWKIKKILEYLDRDDFEKEITLSQFKTHFSKYMRGVKNELR